MKNISNESAYKIASKVSDIINSTLEEIPINEDSIMFYLILSRTIKSNVEIIEKECFNLLKQTNLKKN